MHPSTLPLAANILLLPLSVLAQEHAAHEHGHGELNLALDGQQLLIELHAPAADLVGFEHAPRTTQEQQQQALALQHLQQADRLFVLPAAARCQLQQHQVHDHADAQDEHTAGAAHANDSAHDHEHEHEHEEDHQHSDIRAEYSFVCQQPEQLNSLTLTLFSHYPTLQKLSLQAILPGVPDRNELSASQPTVTW